jgi:hypothetical protein
MDKTFYDDITGKHMDIWQVVSGLDRLVGAIKESLPSFPKDSDIFDFGICTGNRTLATLKTFKQESIPYRKCWGFYSLTGLPVEHEKVQAPDNWHPGAFSISSILNKGAAEAEQYLNKKMSDFNFELVVGFYSDSLVPQLAKKMNQAIYISIDVDLYISTVQAQDFIVENNLIVPGTIIRYDDWGGEDGVSGEHRALLEMCEKYSLSFETIDYRDGVKIMRNI